MLEPIVFEFYRFKSVKLRKKESQKMSHFQILSVKIPTELFACYQRSEQALVLALMEMVVGGVSTRKVAQITEELFGTEFSKSTVSELRKRIDPVVTDWNNRPLHDHPYPFVLVDAPVLKVREDGRIRPRGALIGIGVNTDGYRKVGLHAWRQRIGSQLG